MDRDAPQVASGFYPAERQGERTFAWTSDRALLRLPGLNRRVAWECRVSLRGARPAGEPQPTVDVTVDDVAVVRQGLSNNFQDLVVAVPRAAGGARPHGGDGDCPGLRARAFRPPPPRRSGRSHHLPAGGRGMGPAAATRADGRGDIRGDCGSRIGLAGRMPVVGGGRGAANRGVAIDSAHCGCGAVRHSYRRHVAWLALWIMLPLVAAVRLPRMARPAAVTTAARSVMLFSGAVLYLKLLALLHPSKGLVDALFHARV